MPVSAVVNTRNASRWLTYALRSLRTLADEIVVVDMHSEDDTIEIARQFDARIFPFKKCGFVEPAREFAVSKCSHEVVFILDADEIITPKLALRLREMSKSEVSATYIPRLNYIFGEPIKHGGWDPEADAQLRFFDRRKVRLQSRIHSGIHPKADAQVLRLPFKEDECLIHFNYMDVTDFLDRLNKYTTIEAEQRAELKSSKPSSSLRRGIREFTNRYVRQKGFRDGWRGFYLAWFMATYRVATDCKMLMIQKGLLAKSIELDYRTVAESYLSSDS